MRVLIMGLPGTGKTTMAEGLSMRILLSGIRALWINADTVRKRALDFDFSIEGRLRQAHRIEGIASRSKHKIIIMDLVAPLVEQRDILKPDFTVWMDTKANSRYADTDAVFVKPKSADVVIKEHNHENVSMVFERIGYMLYT